MTQGGGIILLYHRVTRLANDPQLLAVSPENFRGQMEKLAEIGPPMALREMAAAAGRGEDLSGAFAVTFDDGYADNLLVAKPILQKLGIPATVFVAAKGIGSDREFFWDELDRIFLQTGKLPEQLSLSVGEVRYDTKLEAEYSREQWKRFADWNVTVKEDPTARQRVYRELCGLIHRLPSARRVEVIQQIQNWARLGSAGRQSHRMMTAAQLRDLSNGGLIDIGGHTVSHPLLAVESIEMQKREIKEGKIALEQVLGRQISGFSYPFGGRRDYSSETVAAAKEAGFEFACSNFNGVVNTQTDRYQLPRVLVRDWSVQEFAGQLEL